MKSKGRIEYLDLAKGIGIVLVVWAHAQGPFSNYINQFHMPFFFFISGLLYSSDTEVFPYVKNKILHLYIPFAFWNLLSFISQKCIFSIEEKSLYKGVLGIVLTLDKDGRFLGATWFLGALFLVSVLYKILDYNIRKLKKRYLIIWSVALVVSCLGFSITFPYKLSRTMILSLFFASGVLCKNLQEKDLLFSIKRKYIALFCAILFVVIGYNNNAQMGDNVYSNPILFVVGAMCMTYAVIYFCWLWCEKSIFVMIKNYICYLGKKSLDIVIWHLFFFRIIIVLQIIIYEGELTISKILSYYPTYSSSVGWWFVYVLCGIIVSLLWCSFLRAGFWGRLLQKMHVV